MREDKTAVRILDTKRTEFVRFAVAEDRVDLGDHVQTFSYVDIQGGVCVLPVCGDRVILLREYRYPLRSFQWSIPGGILEAGEDPGEAAKRELLEETGYPAEQIASLGAFYTSFGSSNEMIHLFAAKCGDPGVSKTEPGEILDVHLVDMDYFREMIRDGRFAHGAGLAAYARLCASGGIGALFGE